MCLKPPRMNLDLVAEVLVVVVVKEEETLWEKEDLGTTQIGLNANFVANLATLFGNVSFSLISHF